MHAAATALPMPETGPSLGHKWIKANMTAAAVYVALGVLTFLIDKALGSPAAGPFAKGVSGAVNFLDAVVGLVAYAMLTGVVLAEKLPAFSKRNWIWLHAGVGVLFGMGVVAANLMPGSPPASASEVDTKMIIGVLFAAGFFGPIFGAVMGSLQAAVLQSAARRMGVWIGFSALSTAAMLATAMSVVLIAWQADSELGKLLSTQIGFFIGMTVAALVMLPAVKRLTPRD